MLYSEAGSVHSGGGQIIKDHPLESVSRKFPKSKPIKIESQFEIHSHCSGFSLPYNHQDNSGKYKIQNPK